MNRIVSLTELALVCLFSLQGCSGGGAASNLILASSLKPGISNLRTSTSSVLQNSGGGAATIYASVDFIDTDGNLVSFTVRSADGARTSTNPISGASGQTSGTIYIQVITDTTIKRSGQYQIFVTDSSGNNSNVLTGTFTVN